ncbi:hypothetical protein [Marisediminicola sp. LYQ134]|uniref:hypothetical protein n=1 Tax=unclassified Marisediminicola TaxID=2618316 RepID=UPI0039835DAE
MNTVLDRPARQTVVDTTEVTATAAITVTRRVVVTIDSSLEGETRHVSRPTPLGSLVARVGVAMIVWGSRPPVTASVLEARAAMDDERVHAQALSHGIIR